MRLDNPLQRCIPTLFLACSLLFSAALTAQGERQLFVYASCTQSYGSGGLGAALAMVGDINGDGRQDIAVGDPYNNYVSSSLSAGRVLVLSGEDGSVLQTLSASASRRTGQTVAWVGDVDNDQIPDVLTASSATSGGYGGGLQGPTGVTVFSSATGAVLQSLAIGPDAIIGVGDWNNDQEPDFAIGNGGTLEVYGAASGALVTTIATSAVSLASLTDSVSGVRRLAVASAWNVVTTYDHTGAALWSRSGFRQVASAGDLNGDQIADVIAQQVSGGAAEVLSGLDGATLLTVPGGSRVVGGVDLDGDLVPDVAVGDAPNNVFRAYSGQDGSLLFTRRGWLSGEGMGYALAMSPGVGTPPRPAVIAGSPQLFYCSQDTGAVHAVALAAPGEVDGRVEVLGTGCNYQFWTIKPFDLQPPAIGRSFSLGLVSEQTSASLWNFHVFGMSNTTYNGMSLPQPLPSPGLQCDLEVAVEYIAFQGPGGSTLISLTIPVVPAVVGLDLFCQAIQIDSVPGAWLFQTSPVGQVTIGN